MANHAVTWDHSGCDHEDNWCRPEATFTCNAPPDALCVNSCHECDDIWFLCSGGEQCEEECAEQTADNDEEDDPVPPHPTERHCTHGHLITPNWKGECYAVLSLHYNGGAVSWNDAEDQYDGDEPMSVRDGPVDAIPQGDEGVTWHYAVS